MRWPCCRSLGLRRIANSRSKDEKLISDPFRLQAEVRQGDRPGLWVIVLTLDS